jgi:hypothetical protein
MMLDRKKNRYEDIKGYHRSPEEIKEERAILFYGGGDAKFATFTPKINEAIRLFEDKLRSHIRR